MNLKKYTDYALRVLIFTGMKHEGELASIKEISETFSISQHHLGKIVFELNKLDLLETVRGRNGGIRLAKRPEEINVGMVVRQLENDFVLLECFDHKNNYCVISPACKLKHALNEALQAFLHVLDQYTINDLITNEDDLRQLMGID
ncbi:Rrf2 family transcriptional regulator [Virgibacillus dakarensis]|uniref:HTH-type transcriptional regulator NsrR n=1 Tax=Lentibacillus populi TaxID=1827502 RepID=A0A9W5X7J5_9BACI|nr:MULTISPECIES: Rrf2 family transcriptional regulator [Bacillaceae]MBT2215809.1 Rrf2 family transcriptional regulator [Virgibacillus dakarensis]MTW86482.1 Rrf2 family transcriptional regulator [Virgibacillus dakarensis]GGB57001.1 HTH-type transcriptional regulator NsrR [Lentibacillus populi]